MNILLVNPPTHDNKAFIREGRCNQEQGVWSALWPPVSLATAAAVLENNKNRVEVLDCPAQNISRIELLNRVAAGPWDMIVWSTATPSITGDLDLADELRAIRPEVKTAVFGTHVTALAEESLARVKGLDFIIRNEPEQSLAELVLVLEKKKSPATVQGISFREASGTRVHNPARAFIENPDDLPFPAWHLLDLDKYRLPLRGEKFLILAPVRGCPYPCTFCTARTYYGTKLRKRSIQRVVDEILYDRDRFGIKEFFIWADTFTADRGYVTEFCQNIIDNRLSINWTCNSRVDTVDPELLALMARAGCWMISFGIESADQTVLDAAGKKISADQSRNAAAAARAAGIKVSGHFVLGLPGDTPESIQKTIAFSLALNLDTAQYYCAVPFPGSPLYAAALTQGWVGADVCFEDYRQDHAVMHLPHLAPERVDYFRKKAYLKFYLRPARIFTLLRMIRVKSLAASMKGGLNFLRWALSG